MTADTTRIAMKIPSQVVVTAAGAGGGGNKMQSKQTDWREARDPATGKVYYYNKVTRASQWDKPLDMCTDAERKAIVYRERQQKAFFAEMERNIRRNLEKGLSTTDMNSLPQQPSELPHDQQQQQRSRNRTAALDAQLSPRHSSTSSSTSSSSCSAPNRSYCSWRGKQGFDRQKEMGYQPPPSLCRTISTMDDSVIAELAASLSPPRMMPMMMMSVPGFSSSSASSSSLPGAPFNPSSPSPRRVNGVRHGGHPGIPPSDTLITAGGGKEDEEEDFNVGLPLSGLTVNKEGKAEASSISNDTASGPGPITRHLSIKGRGNKAVGQLKRAVAGTEMLPTGRFRRRNSTSSVFVGEHDTMEDPDADAAILCVAAVFRAHITAEVEVEGSTNLGASSGTTTQAATATPSSSSATAAAHASDNDNNNNKTNPMVTIKLNDVEIFQSDLMAPQLSSPSLSVSVSAVHDPNPYAIFDDPPFVPRNEAGVTPSSTLSALSSTSSSASSIKKIRNCWPSEKQLQEQQHQHQRHDHHHQQQEQREGLYRSSANNLLAAAAAPSSSSLPFSLPSPSSPSSSSCPRRTSPSTSPRHSRHPSTPSLKEITRFFKDIYVNSEMSVDCIILPLIYIERMIKVTGGRLRPRPTNWRSLLVSALILSSKVADDLALWNADFVQICPSYTVKRINELELAVLQALSYDSTVSASEYAKYYFLLRSMCARSGQATARLMGKVPRPLDECLTPLRNGQRQGSPLLPSSTRTVVGGGGGGGGMSSVQGPPSPLQLSEKPTTTTMEQPRSTASAYTSTSTSTFAADGASCTWSAQQLCKPRGGLKKAITIDGLADAGTLLNGYTFTPGMSERPAGLEDVVKSTANGDTR